MKTVDAAALDTTIPYWPVVEVNLSEPATVKVHGCTAPLEGDVQAAAVAAAADTARSLGYPIRMRVSSGTGVQCLVVDPVGVVTPLPDESSAPVQRRFRR